MNERLESQRFPYLPMQFELRGHQHDVEALIDTGFDGDLAIPASSIPDGQPAEHEIRATLADGSQVSVPAYPAQARVGAQPDFSILLLAIGDEPSVGLGVTNRFRLTLDHGRRVILEP